MKSVAGRPSHRTILIAKTMFVAKRARAQSGQVVVGTTEDSRQLVPAQLLIPSAGIECLVELAKVPPKPPIRSNFWKRSPASGLHAGDETLRRTREPTQHEERVPAAGGAALWHTRQRRRTDWVIAASIVQRCRLIPDRPRHASPGEALGLPLGI